VSIGDSFIIRGLRFFGLALAMVLAEGLHVTTPDRDLR